MSTEAVISLGRLLRLTDAIHRSRGLDELLSVLIGQAAGFSGVDTVRVLLLDETETVLIAQGGIFPDTGDDESVVPVGEGFAGRIAQTRQPLLVPDLQNFPVYSTALRQAGIRSAAGVPLLAGERLVGVMHIGSNELGAFGPDSLPVLQAIAERVALTVEAIRADAAMSASEGRFRALFEKAPLGVCLTDLRMGSTGDLLLANPAMARLTGYSPEELSRMNFTDLLAPEDMPAAQSSLRDLASGAARDYLVERRATRADGSTIWITGHVAAVLNAGRPTYAVCYVEDITDRKSAEAELARRALTDSVTGLANRHLVIDHLTLALNQQVRNGRMVGALYLDLDRFKDLNDAYGHDAGDRILKEVGKRLTIAVRATDTPGRLGGDEFIVVCPQLSGPAELSVVAERLLRALTATYSIAGCPPLEIGVSIGAAIGDRDTGPEELVRRADVAMYEAKRRGRRRWHSYTRSLDETSRQRLAGQSLLRNALENDWFRLYYQPIIDLESGQVVSAEALLRIEHPERGLLLADKFIDSLEEGDLAEPVEDWVIAEACRQLSRWGPENLPELAINVSGRLASSGMLADKVLSATASAGIHPSRVCLEMTERGLVQGAPAVIDDLKLLTANGVAIAIDDFGIGYASLTYLQRFPVTTVKIDRSFVTGLGVSKRDNAIVAAVTTLGTTLGMRVIAEGVEQERQADELRRVSCPRAQGWLFGRAVPAEAFEFAGPAAA